MTPMVNRRRFLSTTAGAAAGAASLGLAGGCSRLGRGSANAVRPNVLLIMVDDLGPEWVSCYGGEGIETPHIDALARRGMLFENAYSMAQCTPTRATLLTGQYPWRTGWINHWDVPRWGSGCHFDWNEYHSFARVLRQAGYSTAIAGKWQINDFRIQPDALQRHGFDEWCVWTGGEGNNPPSNERYDDPYIFTTDGESKTRNDRFGPDVFTDFLVDFMRRRRDDGPMLLYYPMVLTHPPFTTTPLEPDAETKLQKHKAMVRYTDHLVGRLVGELEDLGIRDETMIVFTTDNGTSRPITGRLNGREVRGGKASLGENGIHQPFIVSAPAWVAEDSRTEALTDFTDIFPTLAELAGAQPPEGVPLDGHSLAPLLLGRTDQGPRDWAFAMGFGAAQLKRDGVRPVKPYGDRAIRGPRYKLWIEDARPTRLFDLQEDPGETHNLIDSTDPEVLAARRRLEAVIDTFPKRDGVPRYDPTPPTPWDRTPID